MDWAEMYLRLKRDREDCLAWEALQQRVRIWSFAHLRRQSWHTVEDLVADTCSSVAVTFDKARGDSTFGGFVYGCYLNERRRMRRHVADSLSSVSLDDDTEDPEATRDQIPTVDEQAVIWQALFRLPERERAAVSLRHLEGLSAEEIGTHLGVSATNARQLVHKALVHLRRQLTLA